LAKVVREVAGGNPRNVAVVEGVEGGGVAVWKLSEEGSLDVEAAP
jgi:hypothetical protein